MIRHQTSCPYEAKRICFFCFHTSSPKGFPIPIEDCSYIDPCQPRHEESLAVFQGTCKSEYTCRKWFDSLPLVVVQIS